jgi:hypothetical protein
MLRRIARAAAVGPLAVLHIACSATLNLTEDPYANCTDLGDLSLLSRGRLDAETRMMERVRELGGDTLLFGERGRSGRLSDVPREIVERRNELLAVAEVDAGQQPTLEELVDPSQASSGAELWYYGAALRCNPTDE